MVATFAAHGATSRERARTLEELGLQGGLILRRLRDRAVVREAAPDRFYLDEESWTAVRRSRRRAVHVVAAVLLAILLAVLFGSRRARAGEAAYSRRSATSGSIVAAFRAGISPASMTTVKSTAAPIATLTLSDGSTPKR